MSTALQGWKPDPFGRFEHRYFSNGAPTPLVRSGRVESRDEPGERPAEVHSSPATREVVPAAPEPMIYSRREHRIRASFMLGTAFLVPLVAWELLVRGTGERIFGVVAFAVVAVLLGTLVRVSRIALPEEPRRRTPEHPTAP